MMTENFLWLNEIKINQGFYDTKKYFFKII